MQIKKALVLAVSLAAITATPARASSPESFEAKVAPTTPTRHRAESVVQRALSRLETLTRQYQQIEEGLQGSASDLKLTYRRRNTLTLRLAQAQQDLNGEAVRVYQSGPGTALEILMAAETTSDLASLRQITNRTLEVHNQTIERVQWLRAAANQAQGHFQDRQSQLRDSARRLRDIANQIFAGLDHAQAIAVQAGLAQALVLRQEQQAFEDLTAQAANSLSALVSVQTGANQAGGLALLGPTGGRTCAIPAGLRQTGQTMSGQASWYGWALAGRHTASGAVFDPRLLTAAHKTLPLGTFLRVQYGGRCAVVLVNDRGPYVGARIIDLSEGAAEWLGLRSRGVGFVNAEILAPG